MKTASSKEYLDFVLDQLPSSGEVAFKPMMGEYIVYFRGRIVGGIYDDRFLVKQTEAARRLMPDAPLETPYEGAKERSLVDRIDGRDFLETLLSEMVDELPEPKKRRPGSSV